MKHSLLLCGAALLSALAMQAQNQDRAEVMSPVKPLNYGNPINPINMCADPTAVEYEGRLYVYGTNDQQEYDYTGGNSDNSYGHIKSLVVMSTTDMSNWTHHGTINMGEVCGSWLSCSWAPSIASRVESDGLTHFYLYFANSGGGVGVVTSTSPVGPWTSPLNCNLVSGSTPGLGPCCWPFDPGILIDEDGTGWLTLGGGDPVDGGTKLLPGNAKVVKLGDDMISFASPFVNIKAPYHFEANELNLINGKFVYIYCSGWSDRSDWSSFGAGGTAPSTCSMDYMISDNPLDPEGWTYGGDILKNPGAFGYPWGNNHAHLHKYHGSYYMIYHTQVMENIAGIKGAYRSLAVNKATVDEENVKINPITMTNGGATQIKDNRMKANEWQEAETMYNGVGISLASYHPEGNMVLSKMQPGAWTVMRNVDFGDDALDEFVANIRGKGRIEIRIDHLESDPVGILDYSSSSVTEQSVRLFEPISGIHNLFLVYAESNNTSRFDAWRFDKSDGISEIEMCPTIVSEEYYSINGVRVENPGTGIYIRHTTYADGTSSTGKTVVR